MTEVRPLRPEDVDAADAMAAAALSRMAEQYEGEALPERNEDGIARGRRRIGHLQRTDPDGAWVATDGEDVVGVSLSLRRGPMWFLSLLAVDTSRQAQGIGRRLLEASLATAETAQTAWILATSDPKALRRYALAGFAPRPGYTAKGLLDRGLIPAVGVRAGDWARDGGLVDDVGMVVRHAPYGPDLEAMSAMGTRLLVVDEPGGRGFCAWAARGIVCLGATTPDVAQRLLWAAMAELPGAVSTVDWLTAEQQWAIDVVLAARLPLLAGPSVCVRSSTGPLVPYLPGGAFG